MGQDRGYYQAHKTARFESLAAAEAGKGIIFLQANTFTNTICIEQSLTKRCSQQIWACTRSGLAKDSTKSHRSCKITLHSFMNYPYRQASRQCCTSLVFTKIGCH